MCCFLAKLWKASKSYEKAICNLNKATHGLRKNNQQHKGPGQMQMVSSKRWQRSAGVGRASRPSGAGQAELQIPKRAETGRDRQVRGDEVSLWSLSTDNSGFLGKVQWTKKGSMKVEPKTMAITKEHLHIRKMEDRPHVLWWLLMRRLQDRFRMFEC